MMINGQEIRIVKNPRPKKLDGPWFSFGPIGKPTGMAHYKTLPAYIGGASYREVHKHFKRLQGKHHSIMLYGILWEF